jgi:hypothetical protein
MEKYLTSLFEENCDAAGKAVNRSGKRFILLSVGQN